MIKQHAINIAQHLDDKRYANTGPAGEFSGANPALDTGALEYPARNFLDGKLRSIDVRNVIALEYFLGFTQFVRNLLHR
jgi:hypothetical protein